MSFQRMQNTFSNPFGVLWRTALVRLPRAVPTQVLWFTSPDGPQPFVFNIPSRGQHKIPLYIFVPQNITSEQAQNLPVVIDFHGGGFFLGSCLEQAPFCAKLARDLGAVVLSVDYRMGPVDKFPAAIHDAEDTLRAVLDESFAAYAPLRKAIADKILENRREAAKKVGDKGDKTEVRPVPTNLDKHRIAISGFSSGGNLALNLGISITHPQEDAPWPSVFPESYPATIPLLLYYPSFDSRQLPSERTRPPNLPVSSPFWSEVSDILAPTYLPREKAGHPRASPGLADVKTGLHPNARVLLVLPGLDSLSEQSESWVKKVAEADRDEHLTVERFPLMKHGWTQMPESWLSEDERKLREEIFEKTITFTKSTWESNP